MNLRETIEIKTDSERIWPLLADPIHWPRWNPKILQIDRDRDGLLIPSEQFGMLFQMKRRQTDTRMEVRAVEPPSLLRLRQHFHHGTRSRRLEISFSLERFGPGSRVTKVIDYSQSGIPFPFTGLIWLLHRLGRPVGGCPLSHLRQLAETGCTSLAPASPADRSLPHFR